MAPMLSIILCSRNDRYMGDSRWRLRTALDYLGERVAAVGCADQIEVIVTDWGSEVPLGEVIRLRPSAARITSFLHVPPPIAQRLQADSTFPEVLALNAAARRARGEYIGRIDQDILVGERFLRQFLAWTVDGPGDRRFERALMFANRRRVPYRFASAGPNFANVTRFIKLLGGSLEVERQNRYTGHLFWTSYVGMWLAHRALWDECGGYDERMIYYNWMEADMICRLRRKYPVIDLGALTGHDFYHLEHYHPRASLFARPHARKNVPVDPSAPAPAMRPSGPGWGLVSEPIACAPARAASPDELEAPEHRNDDVAEFGRMMRRLFVETIQDRAVVWWTVQSRLWARRWRRLRSVSVER